MLPLQVAFNGHRRANLTDAVCELLQRDLLPRMFNSSEGITYDKAWGYNGGYGVSGFHSEDGLVHGAHLLPRLRYTLSPAATHYPLAVPMLEALNRMASKLWVFGPAAGAAGAVAVSDLLHRLFDCGGLGTDVNLVARRYVLDPRHLPPGFTAVRQLPGHLLVSAHPHMVLGSALVSMAWNQLMPEDVPSCLAAEEELAAAARSLPRGDFRAAMERVAGVGELRKLSLLRAVDAALLGPARGEPVDLGGTEAAAVAAAAVAAASVAAGAFPECSLPRGQAAAAADALCCQNCGVGFVGDWLCRVKRSKQAKAYTFECKMCAQQAHEAGLVVTMHKR